MLLAFLRAIASMKGSAGGAAMQATDKMKCEGCDVRAPRQRDHSSDEEAAVVEGRQKGVVGS